MEKKILEALKAKFEGVSESILGRVAKKLSQKVKAEDEVETAVDGVTFASLLESYGDSRATEAAASAISGYEKKHNLKDGKAIEGKKDEDKPDNDDIPAWAKALVESNKSLSDKLAAIEGKKKSESRRAQIDSLVKDLTAAQKKAYARMSVDNCSDEEFAQMVNDVKGEVAELAAENKRSGSVFGRPLTGSGSDGKASKEEVAAVVDKM